VYRHLVKSSRDALAAIDLNMLRALDALVDASSVAVAAERLGITPAAASNALRRLREHFGDPLLVRQGARMRRTPLGERLREPTSDALRAVERVLAIERTFDVSRAEGALRVATSDHVDAVWLEPVRARLLEEAPRVELLVQPYSSDAPARALEGTVDLVVAPRTRFVEALRSVHLADDPYVLVSSREAPFAIEDVDATQLSILPHLVVSPSGDADATSVDRALARMGLQRRIARRVTSFSAALLIVASSPLVSVVPRSFVTLHASRLGLRFVDLPLEVSPARLYVAWSPRLHTDPLHAHVRRVLVACAREA
jgi:DNA-binding transcriptional LysR family regulator